MALIDKVEAAERLIESGILMLERGEDPLAIHVVAASALNMLREMIKLEGEPYQIRLLQEGLFLAATAYSNGEHTSVPDIPGLKALIGKVLPGIESGMLTDPSQIEFDLEKSQIVKMLDDVYRPYNFLKHGDRDPLETLDEGDVNPSIALQHALCAFGWIVPNKEWPETILPFAQKMEIV